MALKLAVLAALITIALAGHHHHEEEHHEEAHYDFEYGIHAPKTGDYKSHKESREGHETKGSYSVVEPDGHKRIVKYTVDKHSGFQAEVHREPTDIKIPEPEHQEHDEHAHSSVYFHSPHASYHH